MKFTFLFILFVWSSDTFLFGADQPKFNTPILGFEENKGQIRTKDNHLADQVAYTLNRGNATFYILKNGAIAYQLTKITYPENYEAIAQDAAIHPQNMDALLELEKQIIVEKSRMDIELLGANLNASITVSEKSNDYSMYYKYNALFVHHYQTITFENIYPNIDWVIKATNDGIKQEFIVHPGGNPNNIKMQSKGALKAYLDDQGNFIQESVLGSFLENHPISFQHGKTVETQFVWDNNTLSFQVSEYTRTETLIIDPEARIWGSYYGGGSGSGGQGFDEAWGITTDNNGNVFLSGRTFSAFNMANLGHDNTYNGDYDGFLAKFTSAGARVWGTYYGGVDPEIMGRCAADANGNVFLCGGTRSYTDIAFNGHQNVNNSYIGYADAYLVKFNAAGVRQWGTFLGGMHAEVAYDCATDPSGNVYICGFSQSYATPTSTIPTLIATPGAYQGITPSGAGGMLVKFSPTGTRLWGTYIGDNLNTYAEGVDTDLSGNVVVCAYNGNLPNTVGGHQPTQGGSIDGMLVKLNPSGGYMWATYYGGSGSDVPRGVSCDNLGNIYMVGESGSTTNIASNGYQNTLVGATDPFLVKFDPSGVRQWGTYYGNNEIQYSFSVTNDQNNNVYIAGYGQCAAGGCTDLANGYGFQPSASSVAPSPTEGFFVKFNSAGLRLVGTYVGGSSTEQVYDCTADLNNNSFVCGYTVSTTKIAQSGFQNTWVGNADAFFIKYNSPSPLGLVITELKSTCSAGCPTVAWTTNKDDQTTAYLLETSTDLEHFEVIQTIKPNVTNHYMTDEICHPTNEQLFRLARITQNGTHEVLETFQLTPCHSNTLTLYPNPGKEAVTISSLPQGTEWIEIASVDGKQMGNYACTNEQITINTADFPAGCYFIKVGEQLNKWVKQ